MSLDPVEETAAEGDSEGNKDNSLAVEMEDDDDDDDQELRAQALRALLLSRQRKHASVKSNGDFATFSLIQV